MVNVVGGCCGTTPEHIARIAAAVAGLPPRPVPAPPARTRFSGLEPFEIGPDTGFVMIGERTNVTGSKRFRRLVESGDYQAAAVNVALEQVRGGANLLDVNMDADLLDGEQAMTTFLNLVATEPEVARLPVMIDSSRWSVLEGRAEVRPGQGRGQLDQPQGGRGPVPATRPGAIRDYGAGVVVMAFDEQGQADTVERKVAICGRAYDLLTQQAGFAAEDIIFDPNVLAVATGIAEHNGYAKAFIDALPLIKQRCPGARTSGGHLQPVLRLPRQRRGARGDALGVPVPRDAGRAGHGHRQRRAARRLPGHPRRPAGAGRGRDLRPAAGRAPTGWSRSPRPCAGPAPPARWTCPGARPRWSSGWRTRWCTASPTSSRPTPRRPGRRWRGRWT